MLTERSHAGDLPRSNRARALVWVAISAGAVACGIAYFEVHAVAIRIVAAVIAVGIAITAGRLQWLFSNDSSGNFSDDDVATGSK